MRVDWSSLLQSIGTPSRTSGRNVGQSHIGLCCPWCGDDTSFHLGINKGNGFYHCWRDPRHSGRNPVFILIALGLNRRDAETLIDDFRLDAPEEVSVTPRTFNRSFWDQFEPALEDRHLDYLASRGFDDPEKAVRIGDLRFSNVGAPAWRILFPMKTLQGVEAWTGRAIGPNMIPPYYTPFDNARNMLAGQFFDASVIVLVEGPMDALKINCAGVGKVKAAAILGKQLSPGRLNILSQLQLPSVYICLDTDASLSSTLTMCEELKPFTSTKTLNLPEGRKDAGEMPIPEIAQWIRSSLTNKELAGSLL